jgi:uncharacterized protein (DUF1015 family)
VPEIQAFRAIRYNNGRFGNDWSSLVAPPYDVLSADDKARLLKQSPFNIVGVDMPFVPPKQAGPPEVYEKAAETLRAWLHDGVVIRDEKPAIYVYHQSYRWGGQGFTRRMLLTAMRLEEFGKGKVFPHELTHGGPKEDRLMLMRATQCQLSPVFGLYSDPSNAVAAALERGDGAPDVTATIGEVVHRMWVETDADTVRHVSMLLAGTAVYIADGHHRYSTAINYRNEMAKAAGGTLSADHPANFVLIGLCAMEDPGCVILPTHRVLSGLGDLKAADLMKVWSSACSFAAAPATSRDAADLILPDARHDIALYVPAEKRYYVGTFTDRGILEQLSPDRSKAWRALDLAYLHRCMLEESLTAGAMKGSPPSIGYTPSIEEAERMAAEAGGVAILVKPTAMADLRAVADANDFMPQKSTFFYPKLATGMVIHPLA